VEALNALDVFDVAGNTRCYLLCWELSLLAAQDTSLAPLQMQHARAVPRVAVGSGY